MADLNEKVGGLLNTKDFTEEFEQEDITSNKTMGILAYISWLVLIPLFAAKESKYARFHVNQGIVLAIVEIVIWVVFYAVLGSIPGIGWLFSIIGSLASLCCLGLAVFGIIHVAKGEARELPLIGGIRILK